MPFDRTPPSEADIRRLFVDVPKPPPQSFELALVLGGTVSAGAYTAGAVDFLIEALDCFEQAKADGAAPRHDLVLKFITGTSGGGVNAAIAARALAYDYPHIIRGPADRPAQTGNPFYDTWVNELNLSGFLETGDIGKTLGSALNGAPIDRAATGIVNFTAPLRPRNWVAAPLGVIVTVTNLRGIPYRTDLGGGLGQIYVDHADHARFAVTYPHQPPSPPRPDAWELGFSAPATDAGAWDLFSQYARATAAFPVGFPTRTLTRPTSHYHWRVGMVPTPDGQGLIPAARRPCWEAMVPEGQDDVPESVAFLTVDGGATNNEPIELARTALAGVGGVNPRGGLEANRAVFLIDPFAGSAPLGPDAFSGLSEALGGLVTAMIQQTRYSTADLMLAENERVFSRFMLTPQRALPNGHTAIGAKALASAGLGAFIGFACREFMRHDYLLGRSNCQDYLRRMFSLPRANPVFDGWTEAQKDAHQIPGTDEVPLVPLFGTAAVAVQTDTWPRDCLDPTTFRGAIMRRYRAIVNLEVGGSTLADLLGWTGALATQERVADAVIDRMRQALREAELD
ncbi:MAG TPA: patatin-like phospholipase family protein [Acetobacteraceae bacterium]